MKKAAVVVVLVFAMGLTALAQDVRNPAAPPAPDVAAGMEAMFGAMAPMMAKMTEMMLEATLKIAEKPETAARVAAFKKNLYDQLQKQGFSKEEALAITVNTALPGIQGGMR